MIKFPKIKPNEIATFFRKAPRIIAERAFLSFLALFFISLIAGGLIFYQYNILAKKKEANPAENPLQFNEKTYEDVLKIWQEREKKLKEAGTKKYFDIFRAKSAAIPASNPGSSGYFLFKFYESRGELLPTIEERAIIWEKMGFGPAANYSGEFSQNQKLLEALKKELQ